MSTDLRAIKLEPLLPSDSPSGEVAAHVLAHSINGRSVGDQVRAVVEAQFALYEQTKAVAPWIGYLARDAQTGEVLGSCSFIAKDNSASVEIAYFTFPAFERGGVATAMARQLLALAAKAGNSDLIAFYLA